MTKTDKFTGRQHITYSNKEEAIGDFKNGKLINGYLKTKTEKDGENIVEFQEGEYFSKVNDYGTYSFYIGNKIQFDKLINIQNYVNIDEIFFYKTSYPFIFNSNFASLSEHYFCNIVFSNFLPTSEHSMYFIELLKNLERHAELKSDFCLMPNLYFFNVQASSQKDISLLNNFLVNFIKNVYLETPYNAVFFDTHNAEYYDELNKEADEGDFSLKINNKLVFESHKFNKKFNWDKLNQVCSYDNNNFESDYKKFIDPYFDKLDFSKKIINSKKASDLNISFEIKVEDMAFRFDTTDWDFNFDQEWKKRLDQFNNK